VAQKKGAAAQKKGAVAQKKVPRRRKKVHHQYVANTFGQHKVDPSIDVLC